MANMLTEKEAELVAKMIELEEIAYNKARIFSKISMNEKLSEEYARIREEHIGRIKILYGMI